MCPLIPLARAHSIPSSKPVLRSQDQLRKDTVSSFGRRLPKPHNTPSLHPHPTPPYIHGKRHTDQDGNKEAGWAHPTIASGRLPVKNAPHVLEHRTKLHRETLAFSPNLHTIPLAANLAKTCTCTRQKSSQHFLSPNRCIRL